MAFNLWETLKESIIVHADLSVVTFVTLVALGLSLSYVVSVMFGSSPQPKHQRSSNSEEEVVKDMNEVPMDTTSSQLIGPSSPPWDVFLSFYGKDTRRNFISNLYYALDQAGIITFRDDPALEKGEEISSGLRNAIKNSKMFVVVISKNYARSSWCLDELVEILSCKRTKTQVVPVFYYVDPSDLRHQKGCFGVALKSHKKRHSVHRIDKWKSALTEIADLSGYHLEKDAKESEADTIRKIVENVVPQASTKVLHLERCLFGIDLAVEEIYQKLSMDSNDVRALGICGMGGIGKTTLAKAFFNKYSHKFDISCFMENVKQISQGGSPLLPLLQQLLIELLREKDYKVRDIQSALRKLKEILGSKKALIVLDDLDQLSYSELLVRICKLFSDGSRMIITARDANLLNQLKVEMSEVDIYVVKHLNKINSLELFSYHAFKKPKPPGNYIALSKSFVTYAGGLPLALKVLGSSLCSRTDVSFWKAKLEKIQKIPVKDIQKILQLSYDELDDETEKAIFLDIVFFFVGKNRDEAVDVFKSCDYFPEAGIPILVERCLLTIDLANRLQMHNIIQDMGRNVIREESKHAPCQRLYLDHEEACRALQNLGEMDKIEGLVIDLTKSTNKYCNAEIFERLPNLRLLKLIDVHDVKGNFKTSFFQELRCISWHGCPWTHLPSAIHLQKLVSFDIPYSRFKILWKDAKLPCLRHLNLDGCKYLKELPESIGQLPCLRHLNLDGCKYLKELPESVGQLTTLNHLNVHDCVNLKRFPKHIAQLTTLGLLDMSGCINLKLLPEQLGNMKGLQMLDVSYTAIGQLPDSIAHMKKLVYLDLRFCEKLRKLPEQFGNMEGLETFYASASAIEQLPDSIAHLKKLVYLDLRFCEKLRKLPEQFGNMEGLETFYASASAIEQLPDSIAHLKKLVYLDLSSCTKLRKLPEQFGNMEGLVTFYASGSAIEQLPDSITHMKKLVYLALSCCKKLRKLPEQIGNTEGLQTFHASASAIEQLPDSFSNLLNLDSLNLGGCSQLKRLPEQLGKMLCLENLDASSTEIEELPDSIGLLPRILSMNFSRCEKLTYVPNSIRNLTSLRNLDLDHKDIRRIELPDATNNMKLENLNMSCNIRVWLPMISSFSSVKVLRLIDTCGSLSPTIPFSFLKLSSLEELVLINCTSHGSSFPELPLNLKTLEVHNHASLEQVPDLSHLRQLKKLQIFKCSSLQSLLKLPPHLVRLTLCECTSLQDLPDLSMLRNLRSLNVEMKGSTLKVSLKNSHLQVGRDELSTFRATLPNREIAEWFDYKNSGCTVSFDIPPNLGDNFVGVAIWVVIKCHSCVTDIQAVITNKTEGMTDTYYCMDVKRDYIRLGDVRSIVGCVRGDDISIKSGDKVKVSFRMSKFVPTAPMEVKMCGAHVILKTPSIPL